MLEYISHYVPLDYGPNTPVTVAVIGVITAAVFGSMYVRRPSRGTASIQGERVKPPIRGFMRYRDMALMVVVYVVAITLAVCTWPNVYKNLSEDIWRIGQPSLMFAFGVLAASVACIFFSVREFFRLLRA
jgi:hypothetical protein